MDKPITDQAEGLRRLLSGRTVRLVAVTGGTRGVGCSTTVLNLAAALAALGREVLVIDEHTDSLGGLAVGACGGQLGPDELVRHALGFSVCCAASEARADSLDTLLTRLGDEHAEIVLVDARCDQHGHLSTLASGAHDVLMVSRVSAASITASYASMKRLHYAHAFSQFRVLLNQVRDAGEARHAFDNLAEVASRYLSVALSRAGCIAVDPLVERARELRRVTVDAFPSSPAARDFRALAADLPYWPLRPSAGQRLVARSGPVPVVRGAAFSA